MKQAAPFNPINAEPQAHVHIARYLVSALPPSAVSRSLHSRELWTRDLRALKLLCSLTGDLAWCPPECLVSKNPPFFSLQTLMMALSEGVPCTHNKLHKGGSSCSAGLGKGAVGGELAGGPDDCSPAFPARAWLCIDQDGTRQVWVSG